MCSSCRKARGVRLPTFANTQNQTQSTPSRPASTNLRAQSSTTAPTRELQRAKITSVRLTSVPR